MSRIVAVLLLLVAPSALAVEGEALVKWKQDLEFLRDEYPKRHRNLFHDTPAAAFQKALADLERELPRLTEHQIIVRVAQLVRRTVGDRDGHSGVVLLRPSAPFDAIPVNFHRYSDGVHVRAARSDHAALVGGRVVSMGGRAIDDAWKAAWSVAAGDNEQSRADSAQLILSLPGVLRAAGLADGDANEPIEIAVEHGDGRRVVQTVGTVERVDAGEWVDLRRRRGTPLRLRNANTNPFLWYMPSKALWFEYLEPQKALYVHYGAVADSPDETVAAFWARVFAFADSNPVDKFIVDLRSNGGGNNFLNRPFLHGMIKRDATIGKQGSFFVLIGRTTFSAAQNIVTQLEAHTSPIFVGEPSGGSPNHYGDAARLTLPNSKLVVRAATLWWQDAHPDDERLWIAPHVAAEVSSADDAAGRDPALEAALAHKSEPSLTEQLRAALAKSPEEAAAVYARWRSAPSRKYLSGEREVNSLGSALFREDRAKAIIVFEINAAAHPQSWLAQQNVGRAYLAAERTDEAIAAFRRAVALSDEAVLAKEQLAILTTSKK